MDEDLDKDELGGFRAIVIAVIIGAIFWTLVFLWFWHN